MPVIVAGNGTYSINSKLDVRLDIEELEKFYKAAKAEYERDDIRLESCRKAFKRQSDGSAVKILIDMTT